jgi:hypothetical protein
MATSLSKLSSFDVRRLHLLGVIQELGGGTSGVGVGNFQLAEHPSVSSESALVNEDMKVLGERGFIVYDERLGGASSARMTGSGVVAWEEFNRARSLIAQRRIELRDVFLRWLYEEIEGQDRHPTRDDFLGSGLSYYGVPYTPDDVSKVGEWLKAEGFISGEGSWGNPAPIYPILTAKGLFTVENERSVSDPAPMAGGSIHHIYNSTVNGPANIAQGSQHVQQSMTNNAPWTIEAARMTDLIEQSLPALGADVQGEVAEVNRELRDELTRDARPDRVRSLANSLMESLSKSGAGALGSVLGTQLGTFLLSLPT